MNSKTKISGFTIVELLIVIVVIGILAAITIITYSGIQERANQSKTISALSQYAKALHAYAIDNDGYPSSGGCLGGVNNKSNRCLNSSGVGGAACFGVNGASNTAAFDTAMETYLTTSAPTVGSGSYSCGGTKYTGGYYYSGYYETPPQSTVARGYFYVYFSAKTPTCPAISGLTINSQSTTDAAMQCMYRLPSLAT